MDRKAMNFIMIFSKEEALQFVEENDVKFIRLAFCDIFGAQKNIAILSHQLPHAFEEGISFDASSIKGFMNVDESDLFLFPDPKTMSVLPWRPQHGKVARFFCDIRHPDSTPFEGDGRRILKDSVNRLKDAGFGCTFGTECEFYLFETDSEGNPTKLPHDKATYFDIAPLDKGENVRREICLTLEEMDIIPESSHHEQGPGQNEIDFKYSDPVLAADNLTTFKSVVKTVSSANGLFASFMPKPLEDFSGNGLHINMALTKNGENIFGEDLLNSSPEVESFIQGILNRIREITLFTNCTTNSYKRFGAFEAPRFITWSRHNRSQLIRIPAATGESCRMELRSPDPSCNPYIVFALLINAGLEGIENKLKLSNPVNIDLFNSKDSSYNNLVSLPESLEQAIKFAKESDFIKHILPNLTLKKVFECKEQEWYNYAQYSNSMAFEDREYFENM